jgi:hypothetical protein
MRMPRKSMLIFHFSQKAAVDCLVIRGSGKATACPRWSQMFVDSSFAAIVHTTDGLRPPLQDSLGRDAVALRLPRKVIHALCMPVKARLPVTPRDIVARRSRGGGEISL